MMAANGSVLFPVGGIMHRNTREPAWTRLQAVAAGLLLVAAACGTGTRAVPDPAPPPPPAPPPAARPPAPPPAQRPPALSTGIQVCIVENGAIRNVTARYNTHTGDSTVNERPFSEVYPATVGYAERAMWYINNEAITVNGRRYVKYGLPRILGINEIVPAIEYRGVMMFREAGEGSSELVLYVPVRSGCEFQPYVASLKAPGVRGE
jgi:hypothetical protein